MQLYKLCFCTWTLRSKHVPHIHTWSIYGLLQLLCSSMRLHTGTASVNIVLIVQCCLLVLRPVCRLVRDPERTSQHIRELVSRSYITSYFASSCTGNISSVILCDHDRSSFLFYACCSVSVLTAAPVSLLLCCACVMPSCSTSCSCQTMHMAESASLAASGQS